MNSSEDRNSAAGKSERRWSSDPLRASKRRSGSKRHFRPKTTYIDSTSFDLQALDAVPSDIQARGPEATEAYNNALMEGKAFLKRVPIMIIGQARTGKTSLKKSLRGEKFDPKEQITEGIETDPSYFKVSTEIWRAGENDNNKTDPGSEDFFEQNIAQSIFGALKNVKISQSPPLRKPGNDSSDTPITDSILRQRNTHSFEEEIPESIATRVEKLLQNNEAVEEEEEIFSILWDFGGQSVYYATHPIFLTEKAIYILACDLSRNPHDKADTLVRKGLYRNKEDICNKTNLDYLDFWLSSVYSLVGPDAIGQDTSPSDATTARLPPVFFVCTHADEPYCSTSDPRDLAVDIYGFLRSKPYKSHLFKDVFVVDNTKSGSRNGCPEVTRLREKLLSVAQGLPQLKEAIPLKWLKFENILRLLREDNCKLMAIGEARQIATDKCGIEHDEQFRTMLDFLHDQKVLIHFNETQLNNLVILDPQWLIDIFKKVITIRRYEYTEDNVERFWLKLQETGILDERLLDHEWKHLIDKYSKETCGSLIAIMERFSLLCPWPSDGENIQYLVPSMLMSPPTNDVLELLASVRTPSLFVRFEVGRVPPGLFTRLVLQFYQWCHEEWKSQKQPELFRNFAQFHILPDEGTSAIIMCHSSSIEIIIHDGSSISEAILTDVTGYNPGLTTSRKIHWQLRLILECMRREFSWLKNMKYEMCICCPVCSQKGSPKCRSHDVRGCECLHLLSESELLQCQYCTQPGLRGDCRICIKVFAPWFSFSGPKEGRTPVNQRSVYGCSDVGERISETFREGDNSVKSLYKEKSLALRHDVLPCIQSESSDPKEIVVQFQECLQLTPADLKNPEPETQGWIRYLANEAKSQNRGEIIEYLRTIVPAGTTGPLLDENLDVRCIPFKIRKELTVELSGGDEWKQLAESFGMSYNEIRLLDKRTFIPCDVVLDLIANHRYLIVGELYDKLVKSGLPGSADLL